MKAIQTWIVGAALLVFAAGCNKPPPPAPQKSVVTFVAARSVAPDSENSMPAYLGVIRGDRKLI